MTGGDDDDCHIPQPAVGDSGIAHLGIRQHQHLLVARFGGRDWSAPLHKRQTLDRTAPADVIAARRTNWVPGANKPSPYPRLHIAMDPPTVLDLNLIGCG